MDQSLVFSKLPFIVVLAISFFGFLSLILCYYTIKDNGKIFIFEPALFGALIGTVLSGLYLLAVFNMPSGYYSFLRFVSAFAIIIFFIINLLTVGKATDPLNIPLFLILVLFNPIFPFYFEKYIWVFIDLVCSAAMQILSAILLFRGHKIDN